MPSSRVSSHPRYLALQADSLPSEPPINSNLQCFSFMDVLGCVSKLKVVFSLMFPSRNFSLHFTSRFLNQLGVNFCER